MVATFFVLAAGCVPVQIQPPAASVVPQLVSPIEAGPYWHQVSGTVGLSDALSYYAALKVLTHDELVQEHQRLDDVIGSSDNRLANVQLVLLACLPGQNLVDSTQAVKSLESARQDADFHRDLGNLFVLINDQLTSQALTKSEAQDCAQTLGIAHKKAKDQSRELAACREKRDEVVGKLRKLQDIERGLIERERKK